MNKQFYEKQLADLKRANRDRKLKLANKFGYKTVEDYQNALEASINFSAVEVEPADIESTTVFEEPTESLDMVIAFDTTGSMRSYIDSVKDHVTELIPELFKNSSNLKLKIIAFGDYCDMNHKDDFGKAYQESNLSDNENYLISFVKNAKNTMGGDGDEFYELVIKKIVEETEWREGKKAVLLIGDAMPHYIGYTYRGMVRNSQIDWREEIKKAADLNIQIDTLSIQKDSKPFYKEVSEVTGGVHLDFKSSNKTSEIIRGVTYARSSMEAFGAEFSKAKASGDEELIGAYKQMGSLL